MTGRLLLSILLAAAAPLSAGPMEFEPVEGRALPDAKPAPKAAIPPLPTAAMPGAEIAPTADLAAPAIPGTAGPEVPAPTIEGKAEAAPEGLVLSGAPLAGRDGARIEKALTSLAVDAAALFDNVRKPKADVDDAPPVDVPSAAATLHIRSLKKYEPAEGARVVRERMGERAPIYYIAPNGTAVALKGDFSSFVEGGKVRLLEAKATAFGSMFVATPRGSSSLKSHEVDLETLATDAVAQGAKVNEAMTRLEHAAKTGGDLRASFAEAQRRVAEYLAARRGWKAKRDAFYAKAEGDDRAFLKTVLDGADYKKNHAEISVGGLLAERFKNADGFVEALYPGRIAELRRAIPDLSRMGLGDVEQSILMDRGVTEEFLENRKTFKDEEIGRAGALSRLQFSFKAKDLPKVLDRLRERDGGALKPLEPELRVLTNEALPALERVDEAMDHLETSIREAKTSRDVNDVVAEAKKTIGSFQTDATEWHARRDALLSKTTDPAVRSFLAAAVSALEWDRSELTLDGLLAKKFRSADALLARLYPDQIKELRRLVPGLSDMQVNGFDRSIFVDKEGVRELVASLQRAAELKIPYRIGAASLGDVPYVAPLAEEGLPAKFKSGDYLLPYKVPGAPDIAELEAPKTALPELKPDGLASDGKDRLRARFQIFDRLIEANFRVLPMMNKSASGEMTKSAARAIVAETGKMVDSYRALSESAGDPNEGMAATSKFKELSAELEASWADLSDAQPLPRQLAARVGSLESGKGLSSLTSLHTLVNYMHKKSLKLLIGRDQGKGSGRLISGNSALPFTDLQEKPLIVRGRLQSPPLAALLPRLAGIMNVGNDRMIVNGDEAWYHTTLGQHTGEIYVKFASPDDGGMLRFRQEDRETDRGKRPRLALLEALLKGMGISYDIEDDMFITAVIDKDHELRSQAQLVELFPALIRALHEISELNLYFTEKDQKTNLGETKVREMVGRMSGLFLAEGGWPEQSWNNSGAFARYYEAYAAKERKAQRKALRAALNEELARLGLPVMPETEAFGQALIQRRFTDAVGRALMTGQLALDRHGVPQPREQRPVEELADAILADAGQAARLASMVEHLGPEIDFEPIGAVGGLRAERGALSLGRAALVATVLRDPETGFTGYARVQSYSSGRLEDLSADGLAKLLRREDLPVPEVEPVSGAQAALLAEKLRAAATISTGDRVLGLAASAGAGGFVTAPVTFNRAGRAGAVLVVPHTTPDDIDAIGKSAAVVATGGGMLSHAAITTREKRIPSVILPDAQWRRAPEDGQWLELRIYRPGGEVREHRGLSLIPRVDAFSRVLREGDVVRVNGATGELSLFDDAEEAAAALRAARRTSKVQALRAAQAEEAAPTGPAVPAEPVLSVIDHVVKKLERRLAAPTVLSLGAVGDGDRDLVGGKFAKLGEILSAVRAQGAHVPSALSVTTQGYLRFLEENGLAGKLRPLAAELDERLTSAKDDEERLKVASSGALRIRALIRSGRLDAESGVGEEIWNGMREHGLADPQRRLAVRSSAVQEDQQDAAFAGAADSYLNVKPDEALARIVENWASFWLPRGILYRRARGIPSAELRPATIVQEMAQADVAGVIFTRNPVSGADEIVINAAYGLGEGIVSGLVQTDLYVARKSDGEEIRLPFVGDKRIAIVPTADSSSTEVRGIEKSRRARRALSLEQTRRLSLIAKALEEKFGYPLDIEFAISGDRIAILQARPVTTQGTQ